MKIFEEVLFVKLRTTIQQKTVKQLILCPFDAWRLAGGKGHETASVEVHTDLGDLLCSHDPMCTHLPPEIGQICELYWY